MIWTEEQLAQLPKKDGFRMRGLETTRLDTFIDAAYAFATTMLIISLGDIPDSYDSLILALKGTPAFAMSFAAIVIFWLGHRRWSRRYGLEDGRTILISLFLIFVTLVYVYPLKLMFSALATWFSGGFFPSEFKLNDVQELVYLFAIYGFGFAVLTLMLLLLHWHCQSKKKELGLNKIEMTITKGEINLWMILCLTGFASGLFALVMPLKIAVYAGFVYFNLPFTMNIAAFRFSKKVKRLLKESEREA